MPDTSLLALFLTGLFAGSHCLGMCGGLVTAMTLNLPVTKKRFPYTLAYNSGRIGSYVLIGAILGGLGQAIAIQPVQSVMYLVASLLLIGIGLHLAGLNSSVTLIEKIGQPVWQRLRPVLTRLLPVSTLPQALVVGALWGWLPCGLVYSASVAALSSGTAIDGALYMLAFGSGTLPNLLLMGTFASLLRESIQKKPVRLITGLIVAGIGVWQLGGVIN